MFNLHLAKKTINQLKSGGSLEELFQAELLERDLPLLEQEYNKYSWFSKINNELVEKDLRHCDLEHLQNILKICNKYPGLNKGNKSQVVQELIKQKTPPRKLSLIEQLHNLPKPDFCKEVIGDLVIIEPDCDACPEETEGWNEHSWKMLNVYVINKGEVVTGYKLWGDSLEIKMFVNCDVKQNGLIYYWNNERKLRVRQGSTVTILPCFSEDDLDETYAYDFPMEVWGGSDNMGLL